RDLLDGVDEAAVQNNSLKSDPIDRLQFGNDALEPRTVDDYFRQFQSSCYMSKESRFSGTRFNQVGVLEMTYDLKWNRRRSIARTDIGQDSVRLQLKPDPRGLDNEPAHHVGSAEARQVDFLIPVSQFVAEAR